ncbi:hypothetical protein Tco_1417938 [Tanacetum coccineum]
MGRVWQKNRASCRTKLDDALGLPFTSVPKTPIGCTPYKLIYGKHVLCPIELVTQKLTGLLKNANFDIKTAGDQSKVLSPMILSELQVLFSEFGDQVLLFNSRLKIFSDKLKSRWSGPFTIVQVFLYGTVELSQNSGPNVKVNGYCLSTTWREGVLGQVSEPKQALRRGHPMLFLYIRCPGFLKPLVLAVFVLRSQELHKSSASFGNPDILILSTNVYL